MIERESITKLPITAIITALNDAKDIRDSLKSISFCDEIILIDLESNDNTLEIAKNMGVTTYSHERVPIVEIIQYEFVGQAKHNWILIIDPDERISKALKQDIFDLFNSETIDKIAGIYVPWVFYFKKHKLKGTVWGGSNTKKIISDRRRYIFRPIVHNGCTLIDEKSIEYKIPDKGDNVLNHYWMTSYQQLFEKHWRYIKKEVENKYISGKRTNIKAIIKTPIKAFRDCFLKKKGYKDGVIGFFLSLFWAWYNTSIEIGIYHYQRKQVKN